MWLWRETNGEKQNERVPEKKKTKTPPDGAGAKKNNNLCSLCHPSLRTWLTPFSKKKGLAGWSELKVRLRNWPEFAPARAIMGPEFAVPPGGGLVTISPERAPYF